MKDRNLQLLSGDIGKLLGRKVNFNKVSHGLGTTVVRDLFFLRVWFVTQMTQIHLIKNLKEPS